jgi:uncharacterized lipoprotein YddW (UPF0748 family)
MRRGLFLAAVLLLASFVAGGRVPLRASAPALKGRAVWAGPRDAGTNEASVVAFVERLAKARVNTLVLEVKGIAGICWPSVRVPEAVVPAYREFDMPAVLIRECHRHDIKFHAWFIDYAEGANSWVVRQHPEWTARNPEGKPTSAEILRGRQYGMTWMCPARRPGYTDQWLVPLIREFAERYGPDAIHHDYVRYPGDLAPDTYCFCDYCLNAIPAYAYYVSPSYPDREFQWPFDRPHLEAHWEKSPRVLPSRWAEWPREMKSRFLLGGSTFPGGNHDLDYYFYRFRIEAVDAFVRLVAEEVRKTKPGMEFSAAIFKNPVQSGRFIGQDWREFAPWVEYAMPMDYRSHIPGDFDTHLDLLAESVRLQKTWASQFKHLWIGVATGFLYEEEREPLAKLRAILSSGGPFPEARASFAAVEGRIRQFSPATHARIAAALADPSAAADGAKAVGEFLSNVPAGYFPPEKLRRTLERVAGEGVEGIVIFSAGGISSAGLWDEVGAFFSRD